MLTTYIISEQFSVQSNLAAIPFGQFFWEDSEALKKTLYPSPGEAI